MVFRGVRWGEEMTTTIHVYVSLCVFINWNARGMGGWGGGGGVSLTMLTPQVDLMQWTHRSCRNKSEWTTRWTTLPRSVERVDSNVEGRRRGAMVPAAVDRCSPLRCWQRVGASNLT